MWTWWGAEGTNGKIKNGYSAETDTNEPLISNKDLMAITTKDLGNWITYGTIWAPHF